LVQQASLVKGGGVVKRLLSVLVVSALFLSLCGCGSQFFVRGALSTTTVSGTVSVVQFSSIENGGTSLTVTLVTFLQGGTSNGVTFCGDQRGQFPMNRFVNATFTPGPLCGTVVQIVIVI
jgi:hypothetical protein